MLQSSILWTGTHRDEMSVQIGTYMDLLVYCDIETAEFANFRSFKYVFSISFS